MTFVVSLHINRWLCRDNGQSIVPTKTLSCTRVHLVLCTCVRFLILNQSEGHLLISLFQKGSAGAFQVSRAGIPEQMSTRSAKNRNYKTKSWFALLPFAGERFPCSHRLPFHGSVWAIATFKVKCTEGMSCFCARAEEIVLKYMSPICVYGFDLF